MPITTSPTVIAKNGDKLGRAHRSFHLKPLYDLSIKEGNKTALPWQLLSRSRNHSKPIKTKALSTLYE